MPEPRPAPTPASIHRTPPARPAQPAPDWRGLGAARQPLFAAVAARCRDASEADDVTHEALLRAARFRERQSEPTRLLAWLVQIATNVHRDHVRQEALVRCLPHDDPTFADLEARERGPSEAEDLLLRLGEREHTSSEVRLALDRSWVELEPHDRAVLEAFYGDGGSAAAAARACAVRPANVKVRLYRARRRLEERIRLHLSAALVARLTRGVAFAASLGPSATRR